MTEMQRKVLQKASTMEALAMCEYEQHRGKLLRCKYLCVCHENDGSDDMSCDVIVRVEDSNRNSILHWNDEWLDPYWDCELVYNVGERRIPVGSYWIDGPSHNALTGERDWRGAVPISWLEYWKLRLFGEAKA